MLSKIVHYFFSALLLAGLLAGGWQCRKDIDEVRPSATGTLTDLQLLLAKVPSVSTQNTFILNNLNRDTVLITPGGVRIFLTDTEELFADENGQVVPCSSCASLTISTTEALRKGDLIAQDIPTVDTDGHLLESGGAVEITVICDGKKLKILPNRKLQVQIPSSVLLNNMLIFNGIFQNNTFGGWQTTPEPAYWANWPSAVQPGPNVDGYELFTNTLGWIGCQKVVDPTPNSFCVELLDGFDSQNTQCYLIFKNMKSIVPLTPTPGSQQFCFPNAPTGTLVRIVTISKLGSSYWLGSKETEVGTNAVLPLIPQMSTEQDILTVLKGL